LTPRLLLGLAAGSLLVLAATTGGPPWGIPLRLAWLLLVGLVLLRGLWRSLRANGHLALAWLGRRPRRASPAYVRALFDDYAARFDTHLLHELAYAVPNRLRDLVEPHLADLPGRRLADLGCGTGLLAPLFRPVAASLEGVDLSPAMLARARARGLYDALHEADIARFLAVRPGRLDLLLAADVLVYLGDLAPLLAAAARSLAPGGLLACSLERHDGEGWVLHRSGRYAHGAPYLEKAATGAGLVLLELQPLTLRHEAGRPVEGYLALLQRPR
jgi:predicted TPR repeat methyltransferase